MSAQVTIRGNLTRDPELTFSKNGKAIAKFGVATSRRVKNDAGEWESQDVSFWDVTAFGEMAENICESLGKGAGVIVVGNMKQSEWEKDGEKRRSWGLVADDVAASCRTRRVDVQADPAPRSSPAAKPSYDDEPPF